MLLCYDINPFYRSYGFMPCLDEYRLILDVTTLGRLSCPNKPKRDLDGLSKLCVGQFNVAINKEMQCSDWSQRPLTEEQIQYAALDAFALLQLFDSFNKIHRGNCADRNTAAVDIFSLCRNYKINIPTTQRPSSLLSPNIMVNEEEMNDEFVITLKSLNMKEMSIF